MDALFELIFEVFGELLVEIFGQFFTISIPNGMMERKKRISSGTFLVCILMTLILIITILMVSFADTLRWEIAICLGLFSIASLIVQTIMLVKCIKKSIRLKTNYFLGIVTLITMIAESFTIDKVSQKIIVLSISFVSFILFMLITKLLISTAKKTEDKAIEKLLTSSKYPTKELGRFKNYYGLMSKGYSNYFNRNDDAKEDLELLKKFLPNSLNKNNINAYIEYEKNKELGNYRKYDERYNKISFKVKRYLESYSVYAYKK